MKILTLSIITILVIGFSITAYAHYEPQELLEYTPYKSSTKTPEKSSTNTPEKNNINGIPNVITWDVIQSPGPKDETKVIQAIERGFEIWEEHNPTLNFKKVDGFPDIIVHWNMEPESHVGLAQYTKSYGGIITIQMGNYNCESRFVEFSSNFLTNTTMHEIGHLLGLGHTTEKGHLMYSYSDPRAVANLDDLGYNIPKNLEGEGYFVLELPLRDRIDLIDKRLANISNHDYYNHLIEERNLIVNKINCFHNHVPPLDNVLYQDILNRIAILESKSDNVKINLESISEVIIEPVFGSSVAGCQDEPEGCHIPLVATVDVGGKVIFSNTDNVAHTFTSGTSQGGPNYIFDSGLALAGSNFEYETTEVGVIEYFCIVHPWKTGIIIVR